MGVKRVQYEGFIEDTTKEENELRIKTKRLGRGKEEREEEAY